jgi:hypothetical protein
LDKIQTIEKLFNLILILSYLLIPVICLILRKKDKIFVVLAVYGSIFFCLLLLWDQLPTRDAKILYQYVYTTLEYIFFSYFLWSSIQNVTFKKIIFFLSICFVAFQVTYYLVNNTLRLDTIAIGIETILLLVYIIYFFYEYFNNVKFTSIINHYCFWLSVGILVYLGGTFFFNILAEQHAVQNFIDDYWYFTYLADTLKNILFIAAIFVAIKYRNNFIKPEMKNVPYLDMI